MQQQMRGILDVLSPLQQAKFLVWMEGGMNGTNLIAEVKRVLQMNQTVSPVRLWMVIHSRWRIHLLYHSRIWSH